MNIQFDSNISQSEAQGIILLLQSLFPPALNNSQPVNSPQAHLPDPAPAEQTTHTQSGPTPINEPSTRKRRTKAEIAADEAQAKAQAALAGGVPVTEVATTEAQLATEAPKPISADELRNLLNAYIASHSMEAAIAILQEFNCGRVSEALALDPIKLNELASKLRG